MTDMRQWLSRVSENASVNAIAGKAEVSQKTLDTQLRAASGLKPDMVVRIARAYGAPVVPALVELGLITRAEARSTAGVQRLDALAGLADLDDEDIVREIQRRLEARPAVLPDATITSIASFDPDEEIAAHDSEGTIEEEQEAPDFP